MTKTMHAMQNESIPSMSAGGEDGLVPVWLTECHHGSFRNNPFLLFDSEGLIKKDFMLLRHLIYLVTLGEKVLVSPQGKLGNTFKQQFNF